VLSGNRNFEGRVSPDVRANYLASPPLVVAYALKGTVIEDMVERPIGTGSDGSLVYLRDIWPTNAEIREMIDAYVNADMFKARYADVFKGDERWQGIPVTGGATYAWPAASTYIANPPYFEGMSMTPMAPGDIVDARPLAVLGDSITTDHISPAGSIKADSPAGTYLTTHGVARGDFNSYGARRGNHDVMMRGTFANIRIKNKMVAGVEGGFTRYVPTGEQMAIYDAAMRYKGEDPPRGDRRQGIWYRLLARLGSQGHQSARRSRRHRRDLRAHPSVQPGRHGRAAASVHGRAPGLHRGRGLHHPRRRRRPAAPGDRCGGRGRRRPLHLPRPRPHRHVERAGIFPPRRHPSLRPARPRGRRRSGVTPAEIGVEIAGWVGASLILGAYLLLSIGRVTGRSPLYQWMNVAGAAGFIVNGWWHGAIPSAVLNIVWMLIGAVSLWKIAQRRSAGLPA
jgi:aconitate hydratase